MNAQFLLITSVNLGILLIASWALGLFIISRQNKDRQALEERLEKLKKKAKQPPQKPKKADYPLSPLVVKEEEVQGSDEASEQFLNTFNTLKEDITKNDKQLSSLHNLYQEQQASLSQWKDQDGYEELLANHQESQEIIDQLQNDLENSKNTIKSLEVQLQDSMDKDGRIAILEKREHRLEERVDTLKANQEQTKKQADGLRVANEKNKALRDENGKLRKNIKQLANASEEQMMIIRKINDELEKAQRLEEHQRQVISDLKQALENEEANDNDDATVKKLQLELKNIQDTLDRTLVEKDFIESHLIEMDKTLEKTKETEIALQQAQEKIRTIETQYPEFTEEEAARDETEKKEAALPQLEINENEQPELFNVVADNRLFGILQEFWITLDVPPLQVVSEKNIQRPSNINTWVKTSINDGEFFVMLGTNKHFAETLSKGMFSKNSDASASEQKDALGELGNLLAGNLANELNPDYIVGISEHIENQETSEHLASISIATEVLVNAAREPLYLTLARQVQ